MNCELERAKMICANCTSYYSGKLKSENFDGDGGQSFRNKVFIYVSRALDDASLRFDGNETDSLRLLQYLYYGTSRSQSKSNLSQQLQELCVLLLILSY